MTAWSTRCAEIDGQLTEYGQQAESQRAYARLRESLSTPDEPERPATGTAPAPVETRGWGDLVVESNEFRNYHGSGSSQRVEVPWETRAALALADFPTALKRPYLHTTAQYRESTPLLDAIPQITVSSNSVEWVRWAPNPVPAASVVAEGAPKPEMALTATAVSDTLETYAHWKGITRQALEDIPQVRSIIESRLRQGLARALDTAATAALNAGTYTGVSNADMLTGIRLGSGDGAGPGVRHTGVGGAQPRRPGRHRHLDHGLHHERAAVEQLGVGSELHPDPRGGGRHRLRRRPGVGGAVVPPGQRRHLPHRQPRRVLHQQHRADPRRDPGVGGGERAGGAGGSDRDRLMAATVAEVRVYLGLDPATTVDEEALAAAVAAANDLVTTFRPDLTEADPWAPRAQQAAIVEAARLYGRRGSVQGVAAFADIGVSLLPRHRPGGPLPARARRVPAVGGGVSYDRALELAEKIQAAGVPATVDPRSATPPCVLVTPPGRTYDLGCGYTAAWQLMALVPGTGQRRRLQEAGRDWRPWSPGSSTSASMTFQSYVLAADNPPHPAYRIEFEEAISWP